MEKEFKNSKFKKARKQKNTYINFYIQLCSKTRLFLLIAKYFN